MASLEGVSVASSYTSLLKLSGNTDTLVAGDGTNAIQVVDGDGTASPLYLNTDRLGIGGQPTEALDVTGNGKISGNFTVSNGILTLGTADTSSGHINAFENMSFNIDTDNDDTNRFFEFSINGSSGGGTELMRLTEGGLLGIGGTPDKTLHLIDDSRVDIKFTRTGFNDHYIRKDGDFLRFRGHDDSAILLELKNNSQNNVVSFPSGNVQIGSASSTGQLQITGDIYNGAVDVDQFKAITMMIDGDSYWAQKAQFKLGRWENSAGSHARSSLQIALSHANVADNADADVNVMTLLSSGSVGIGITNPSDYESSANNLVVGSTSGNQGITIVTGNTSKGKIHFADGTTGAESFVGYLLYDHNGDAGFQFGVAATTRMKITSSSIEPGIDDSIDLGSGSLRFDDIFSVNAVTTGSDKRLKDNIADSSLGLDFINALRPVKYKWKDYTYDVEKEEAIEAKEAEYETVVVQEAVEAKEAVMGTRQKTVSKEVEKTKTEIVEEDGKYVQKEVSYTETVEEPQYEEVNLYDEDGEVIGSHKIPVMEEYEVEPAVEAVKEITEERLVSEAIEAKDAVMETKEKTFARTHFGLIAQEVEQVLKDSSLTNNDFAGLIYDEDADRYGIRYSELISPLIKAVQELSKKVTDLENK